MLSQAPTGLDSMPLIRKATAVVTLATTSACYSSVPLPAFPPPVNTDVVATFTDPGATQMTSVLGPRIAGVSGRYLGLAGDSLIVSVKSVLKTDGNEEFWKGEEVRIPRETVANLRGRQFSAVRSGAIVAGVVAALVGISSIVFTGHAGTNQKPPPPPQ